MTAAELLAATAAAAARAPRARLFVEDSVEDTAATPPARITSQTQPAEDATRSPRVAVGVRPAVTAAGVDISRGRGKHVEAVAQGGEPLASQMLVDLCHFVVCPAVLTRQLVQNLH